MKYLKQFESYNNWILAGYEEDIHTIESILDDHLDEFAGAFDYFVRNGSYSNIVITIQYSPKHVDCPIVRCFQNTSLTSTTSTIDNLNEIDLFKRIYSLTDYKVWDSYFSRNYCVELLLKKQNEIS